MTQIRFTVVTPNYNMGKYIEETIQSVLKNLTSNDEYYIIDGGSTDKSIDIIKRYNNYITNWVSESDGGYAEAIHKGLIKGTGKYQCWINSGDVLLKGAFNQVEDQFKKTDADMIFGDDFYIDEESKVIRISRGLCKDLRCAMIYGQWTPLQDACFWKSELYHKVGGLNISLKNAADYDLFARFSQNGITTYVPIAFSAFRRHEGQRSIHYSNDYKRERERVRKKLISLSNESNYKKKYNKIFFYIDTRWRYHILRKFYNLEKQSGLSITDMHSCQYL